MPAIRIRGMGIACALGRGVVATTTALQARAVPSRPLVLADLCNPITMPYYRIPDDAPLFAPERLDVLLGEVVREAIETAGLTSTEIERLPLFVGSTCFSVRESEARYQELLRHDPASAMALPLVGYQHLAESIQRCSGARGATYAFNTACTAGANALMCAARMIRLGWYRHALVVGVDLANQTTLAGFSGLQLIAPAIRPFDRHRSGIILGEGIAAVLLSADGGDAGVTLVAGASNGDDFSVVTANPDGSSIAAVQTAVLRQADLGAEQVLGIKSHGTASPMNDTGEALGMRQTFGNLPPICALKPYLGHTLGACGVVELVVLAAAFANDLFPATPGFEEEDPELRVRPERLARAAAPGHYLLNYFGFGGNNTCLLVRKE